MYVAETERINCENNSKKLSSREYLVRMSTTTLSLSFPTYWYLIKMSNSIYLYIYSKNDETWIIIKNEPASASFIAADAPTLMKATRTVVVVVVVIAIAVVAAYIIIIIIIAKLFSIERMV